MSTILVTGGAGFIGSAVVRRMIRTTENTIINVDKLTYAGSIQTLQEVKDDPRHVFVHADVCDGGKVRDLLKRYRPDKIMHLAAETHVDRSIDGPKEFVNTNVVGTFTLLEAAREYFKALDGADKAAFRFHHVSTDEVYGSLGKTGYFTEQTAYRPNSPYSATKAAADHLVRAWWKTYELPAVISNCSNNYGPYQYPEKLIPLMIEKAVRGERLPVYGKGDNVRDWLYVDDHARALMTILEHGKPGEIYNVGGGNELSNIEVVEAICTELDRQTPKDDGRAYSEQIEFVEDRPGHDKRYAIDASKIKRELGWTPEESFGTGLQATVRWYLTNSKWCERIRGEYDGKRLGVKV